MATAIYWYVMEVEGNVQGSTRMGACHTMGTGHTLEAAQARAVAGFLDGVEGALDVPNDAVDFAYYCKYCTASGRTVIALRWQNGVLQPWNQ